MSNLKATVRRSCVLDGISLAHFTHFQGQTIYPFSRSNYLKYIFLFKGSAGEYQEWVQG